MLLTIIEAEEAKGAQEDVEHTCVKECCVLKSFGDKGGAQLYVPPGRWLTGSFNLTLFLEKDALILASQSFGEESEHPLFRKQKSSEQSRTTCSFFGLHSASPPPPFASRRPNSGTSLLPTFYPSPPPPPPPFASRRPNSGTMLPPPAPPPPPFASERPNSGTSLLPTFYPSPPPLPPRPDFSSSRIENRYYLRFLTEEQYTSVDHPPRKKGSPKPLLDWVKITRAVQGTLWDELQRRGGEQTEPIFDASEIQSIFSVPMPKPQVVRLIDLRRANSMEVLLAKVKMPLPDMMAAVQAMDDTVLDVDQVKNLIKFKRFPTEEEMETLENYTGDKAILGKCEQFLLELMKVPRVEYKLKVFSFKIQFDTQITEFEKRLNAANSASEKVRSSEKLKQIMKHILYLGNTLNQGTLKGSAVGFRLETLMKLSETFAPNINMTLMHYLCKSLASKAPHLLDFHKDLQSLESASEIKMKSLAKEKEAIYIGLDRLSMELYASESDGPVYQVFRQKLEEFFTIAEARVETVINPCYVVGEDADALVYYFGEDPYLYPVEKVAATLLKFVNLFKKAHEENVKQAYYKGPGAFGSSPPPPPPPPSSKPT